MNINHEFNNNIGADSHYFLKRLKYIKYLLNYLIFMSKILHILLFFIAIIAIFLVFFKNYNIFGFVITIMNKVITYIFNGCNTFQFY